MTLNLSQALQNLDSGLYPYSPANAAKVRGSTTKCAKLPGYNCPLEMIPVDVGAFVRKWAKNIANRDAPEGFKTFDQFRIWHSNVKSLMDHASGKRALREALRKQDDDWTLLHDHIQDLIRPRRQGCGIQSTDLVSLVVLQSVAREEGIAPHQVTAGLLLTWLAALGDTGRRNAVRKSARLLDRLHSIDGFAGRALLPPIIGPLPKVTCHRKTPDFPANVIDAIEAYLSELAEGQCYTGLASNHRRRAASPKTVTSVREQLFWYFSALVELDRLDLTGTPDMSDLMASKNILAAFNAERDGQFYWKPLAVTTTKKNMGAVFRFARRYHPDLEKTQSEFFQQAYFDGTTSMTKPNQDYCRRLVRSPERVSRFLNLAGNLHHDAAVLLEKFDELTDAQKTRALRLSTAAATAAVLTFLPLRASTLVNLRAYGDDPHITFPISSRNVAAVIPASLMKNNKPMTAEFRKRGKIDPRSILEWWLRIARAKVMERLEKPDPLRLLGGANYGYIAEAWRLGTAEHNIYMKLHQVRHSIATILLNEPGTDVECIAALLGDSPSTVLRAYAFFDRDKAFARGQTGLAAVNQALSRGRGKH